MDRGAPNSHKDLEQASGLLLQPSKIQKYTKDARFSSLLFFFWVVCVCVDVIMSGEFAFMALRCLQKCCLKWQRFLMDVANVQTTTLVCTHLDLLANTRSRYGVRFCGELHYVYQLPLSFKNFYFPYLNMLIFFQLSFRATWYPLHATAAKSQCLSIFLSVL